MQINSHSYLVGIRNILPILPSSMVFGFIFGLTGGLNGFSLILISSMSWIIFAGSAQFLVLLLMIQGEALLSMIALGLIVNARHLIYGAAIRERLAQTSLPKKLLASYLLTDEAFLVTSIVKEKEKSNSNKDFSSKTVYSSVLIGAGASLWLAWNSFTIIGYFFSALLVGLEISSEFVVSGTFLGLLVTRWQEMSSERAFLLFLSTISFVLAFLIPTTILLVTVILFGIILFSILKNRNVVEEGV